MVVHRLNPHLDSHNRKDLRESIESLEKWYKDEIKALIDANIPSVNVSQVKRIFKYVQKALEISSTGKTIETDEELQESAIEEITKILKNKEEIIEEEPDEEEDIQHEESAPEYNYYHNENYQNDQAINFSSQFRQDIDSFINEVKKKKSKMLEAKQKVILMIK